jgi:hypothetical protein
MSKPPRCKLCKHDHWLREPHFGVEREFETNVPRETVAEPVRFDWPARERELGLRGHG